MSLSPSPLRKIDLFQNYDPDQLETLSEQCRWKKYKANEIIIDRQSKERDVCFIAEGYVRIVNHSLSGKEISFEDIQAGSYAGELSAIDGHPRSATIIALNTSLVGLMPADTFVKAVSNSPILSLSVMQRLTFMLRHSTLRIMDLSTLAAQDRIHAELLRLGEKSLRTDNTARISPIPIHNDIASRVSTTRETVARVLSELAKDNLVIRDGRALVITDFQKMKDLVEQVRGE